LLGCSVWGLGARGAFAGSLVPFFRGGWGPVGVGALCVGFSFGGVFTGWWLVGRLEWWGLGGRNDPGPALML